MRVTGGCHCGSITVEAEADPEKVLMCNCTDCQTGTGSGFRISVPVLGEEFEMTGTPVNYLKTTAESGNHRILAFCGQCGSPLYSTSPGPGKRPSYMLRVGILNERDRLPPKRQIWFRSARDWVSNIGEIPKSQKQE